MILEYSHISYQEKSVTTYFQCSLQIQEWLNYKSNQNPLFPEKWTNKEICELKRTLEKTWTMPTSMEIGGHIECHRDRHNKNKILLKIQKDFFYEDIFLRSIICIISK